MKAQEKYAWCISTCPRLFNRSNITISKLITKHFLLMDTELQSANNTITINEKLSHRHDEKKNTLSPQGMALLFRDHP